MHRRWLNPAHLMLAMMVVYACPFDSTLRAYLNGRFWWPFAKEARHFERAGVKRANAPFAGMTKSSGSSPLAKLRSAYQNISQPSSQEFDAAPYEQAIAAARADRSLTPRDREEVELIAAKVEMRLGQPGETVHFPKARRQFEEFLRTANTPEFLSEARGWLARILYLTGDQTAAGKMYLDELNRAGSNLSRETLLDSLHMVYRYDVYRYDAGKELRGHLAEYFDTAEQAAFAIQIATNPHLTGGSLDPRAYPAIRQLLDQHTQLFRDDSGQLGLLAMRTALRMGDPAGAVAIAKKMPARSDPDFLWMLGSAQFLSHQYAEAEQPLLQLFRSPAAEPEQKAAAAYGLCGVYRKTGQIQEQLRFALWLHYAARQPETYAPVPTSITDGTIYWAPSGWDLAMLLETEAPVDALRKFADDNPRVPEIRLVKYALAVRLTREKKYDDAAALYRAIQAPRRAQRIAQLAALAHEAEQGQPEARYKLAEFLSAHSNGILYNDTLWTGLQRYALNASAETRVTRAERTALIENERRLKDDQEELWQAYLILRGVKEQEGQTPLGRKAATLAVRCLRRISERFGRAGEIRDADLELSRWLQQAATLH